MSENIHILLNINKMAVSRTFRQPPRDQSVVMKAMIIRFRTFFKFCINLENADFRK